MKKEYITPEFEIIKFLADDVIVTSLKVEPEGGGESNGDFEDNFGDGTTTPWG